MSGIIKSSAKILAIAALAIGFSAIGSAQTSILNSLSNNEAAGNTAASVSMAKKGGDSDKNGDKNSNDHTGSKGRGGGGEDKGHKPPPNCVPEPVSMLALGIGSGIVMLKKRAKKA